jgi:hypothetical protein
MNQYLRRALGATLCAGASLALTACGPFDSSAGGGTPTVGAAATSQAPDPTAGLPKGPKLAGWLLPASAVPKLKVDPSGTQDSGDVYGEPTTAALSKEKACALFGETSWISAAGLGSASFAQSQFVDSYSNMFAQEIDSFQGDGAATVLASLRRIMAQCATFKLPIDGKSATAHLKIEKVSGLGPDALHAVITMPGYNGGTTLVAARVGKLVVTTLYNDQVGVGQAGVTLTQRLVKGLPAAAS